MRTRLIFNGDDFGRSPSINTAIIQAHRQGILTSASLMVTGDAFEEAVGLARLHPTLAVGLHLVIGPGRPALPPAQIPHLVTPTGQFLSNPVVAGVRIFLHPAARAELAREIEAQFVRFAETGLPLDHVNGHLHFHLHPTVFDIALPLAEKYGACGVRIPRDRLGASLAWNRRHAVTKLINSAVFARLNRRAERRLLATPLIITDHVYGFMQSGAMAEGYVARTLQRLDGESAEFYFHPDLRPAQEPLGPNPGDLATLLSESIRHLLESRGIVPITYRMLAGGRNIAC